MSGVLQAQAGLGLTEGKREPIVSAFRRHGVADPRSFLVTMNLRLILPAAATILLAASCTPYVEPPPEPQADPAGRKMDLTPEEQEKINKQREEKRKKEEEARKTDGTTTAPDGEQAKVEPTDPDAIGDKPGAGTTKPPVEKKEIAVARPVPGKPGFVFSPFNNKMIDVKGFPPGSLVADPTYPASEKKHFRVP